MKAVVAALNQEKALVGAFSVITNLRMQFGCNFLRHYRRLLPADRRRHLRGLRPELGLPGPGLELAVLGLGRGADLGLGSRGHGRAGGAGGGAAADQAQTQRELPAGPPAAAAAGRPQYRGVVTGMCCKYVV